MSAKIDVSDSIHLANPCDKSDIYRYEGLIENFEKFNQQINNYEKIQASLAPFGLRLTYIWAGIFQMNGNRLHFVAKDDTNKIFWQKYEANSKGSGQNYIYINGIKHKTTQWLAMTEAERSACLT